MIGKILDSNMFDSEESELELAAMLIGTDKYFADISVILSASDFRFTSAGKLYSYLQELYGSKGGYIFEEVAAWAKDNIDPHDWGIIKNSVREIVTNSLDSAMLRAKEIKRYSLTRQAYEAAGKLSEYSPADIEDGIEETLQELLALSLGNIHNEPKPISDIVNGYSDNVYAGVNEDAIFSGYEALDRMLQFSRSDVIVIAARPSVGKSALAVNLGVRFAVKNYRTTLFSLEMGEAQVLNRTFAYFGQIPLEILKNKRLKGSEYENKFGRATSLLFNKPLFIQAQPNVTVSDIKRTCRRNKSDVVIIDYLQLLTPPAMRKNVNRAEEVGEMTRQLKIMAKELNALVIVLSQLNRAVESRASARPNLSDLRESGSIEQDANAVILLSKEKLDDGNSDILLDIAKNRDGMTGVLIYAYDRVTQTLRETERPYVPPLQNGKRTYNF